MVDADEPDVLFEPVADEAAAAEASDRRDRQRLWDAAPQLFRPAGEVNWDASIMPAMSSSSSTRQEIPPAVRAMKAAVEAEVSARQVEENAVALALEMSIADMDH